MCLFVLYNILWSRVKSFVQTVVNPSLRKSDRTKSAAKKVLQSLVHRAGDSTFREIRPASGLARYVSGLVRSTESITQREHLTKGIRMLNTIGEWPDREALRSSQEAAVRGNASNNTSNGEMLLSGAWTKLVAYTHPKAIEKRTWHDTI